MHKYAAIAPSTRITVTGPARNTRQSNTIVIIRIAAVPMHTVESASDSVGFHQAIHRMAIATIDTDDVSTKSLRSSQAIIEPKIKMMENATSE
jgi:hypothetical protein